MSELVLHAMTEAAVRQYVARPAHAGLLVGPAGSGKASIANYLAANLLAIDVTELEKYPYITRVSPIDGKAISIDSIRQLQQVMTLKIPGNRTLKRIVVIEDAHSMTTEAQNALLKTLEEPPLDTVVLLTATSTESLLPTIQSRVRLVHVVPPEPERIQKYFNAQGFKSMDTDKALMIAGNLPGLAHALLNGEQDHPLFAATVEARGLLQGSVYERMVKVDVLSKQKDLCMNVLLILSQMSRMALMRSPEASGKATDRWQQVMKASYDAQDQLRRNTSTKLVMTNLMLEI